MIITNSNLSFVKALSEAMKHHKFMLSYRGTFSQQITKSILAITEHKMDMDGTEISTKKKVFNVMVECLQNICKHGEKAVDTNTPGLFMIGRVKEKYIIYSGNEVLNDRINELTNKLIAINSMSKDELKELYVSLIAASRLSNVGGAGLGLIDIAKKSGNKLDYDFQKFDDQYSYFTLRTTIDSSKNSMV